MANDERAERGHVLSCAIIASNLSHIKAHVTRPVRVVVVNRVENDTPSWRCAELRDALRVGCIYLSKGFFSVLLEEREALKTIRDELCRFAIVTEPAKTLFGKIRRTYTGKLGGLQDDLCICLQLCVTGLRCFYQNDKYQNFRPEL